MPGSLRKVHSPRRSSPNVNHHTQVKQKFHPSSSDDIRTSSRQAAPAHFENVKQSQRTLPPSLLTARDNMAHSQFGYTKGIYERPFYQAQCQ
ncbi:hypothetical protein L3X38_020483 [Prunus dulcis]|uniref:Uncharacterized protein n=1 Tax=Prunus dulcis TaxID=3755 RepID=A0AAD4WEK7_PRUDU|nr:hypothetical protein L3X38_020483 [Prunus dulcis]